MAQQWRNAIARATDQRQLAAMRNRPDNHLYYGDNLDVLREHVPSDSVDLVYLDPPFNSILTLAELFQGKKPDIPYIDPGAAFRKAAREHVTQQGRLL